MSLPVDLAAASREELIEVVGQLLSYIGTLEARIAELEGQAKPPTDGRKQGTPPAWVKANRPARAKKERRRRSHGFARRREEPTHRVEHATASCPDCQVPLQEGTVGEFYPKARPAAEIAPNHPGRFYPNPISPREKIPLTFACGGRRSSWAGIASPARQLCWPLGLLAF